MYFYLFKNPEYLLPKKTLLNKSPTLGSTSKYHFSKYNISNKKKQTTLFFFSNFFQLNLFIFEKIIFFYILKKNLFIGK